MIEPMYLGGLPPQTMSEQHQADEAEAEQLLDRQLRISAAIVDPHQSTRIPFDGPLTDSDYAFVIWLSERYEGKDGTPVMTFECDGITTLVVPADLQRKR